MQNLNITIIQTKLYWEAPDKNLDMLTQKMQTIKGADVVVLPEMFSTGFSMNSQMLAEDMNGKCMQWLKKQSANLNAVVTGSFIAVENNQYCNRLVWMKPDGNYETYDKRHLFRMAQEDKHYSPGNKKLITEWKGWKICPMVCYDLRFPVWSRNRFEKHTQSAEYDVLIYIANWPEKRNHAWKTLLQARAIENLCYTVGVNRIGTDGNEIPYSGDSAVVNYLGEKISTTQAHTENTETITLSYTELADYRKKFPAGLDADEFELK